MRKDPFSNFKEAFVKEKISYEVLIQAKSRINPNSIALSFKYGAIFIMTLFFSLIICPQRGFSFIKHDFQLFHHLLHRSEVLCGLYCGFIFFLTTHLLTFLLLTHFEKVKIIKQVSFLPVLFMSTFFGLSMTSLFSPISVGWSYSLSWLFIVGASYYTTNQLFHRWLYS